MSTKKSIKSEVLVPDWVNQKIPPNILHHLKFLKTHLNYSKNKNRIQFAFFAVRSGVEVQVYKKVYGSASEAVATLALIPGTVICVNEREHKSRANQAVVRKFERTLNYQHHTLFSQYQSGHDGTFKYRLGKIVKPAHFDTKPDDICTSGIHFFFGKKNAENY